MMPDEMLVDVLGDGDCPAEELLAVKGAGEARRSGEV